MISRFLWWLRERRVRRMWRHRPEVGLLIDAVRRLEGATKRKATRGTTP